MRIAVVLLALLAVVAFARPVVENWLDDDIHLTTITEDWIHAYSHLEGLYGVVYSASISAADTAEFFCDIGVTLAYVPQCRIRFLDTDGTAAPVALIISTDATRDSIGTGLTEFKLDESNGGTISAAWYLNPAGTNGTTIARYLLPHDTWFELPEWLAFNADYRIGIVLADTAYVNFEAIWTEEE